MAEWAIEGLGLGKRFRLGEEAIQALDQVTLQVRSGEFVAVMGASGSGKSTLLHLLGLLDTPDEGEVVLAGQRTSLLDDDALTDMRRNLLGFVFQGFELIPNLSAEENILLPAEIGGRGQQARPRMKHLLEQLGLSKHAKNRPRQLSGGQRQRVALARALINDPIVVLADEPTGNLDSRTGEEVLELFRQGVEAFGWTIVMVTHNPSAAMFSNRIVFLKDGRKAREITTKETDVRGINESFLGL